MTIFISMNLAEMRNPWQRQFNRLKPSSVICRRTTVLPEVVV